MASGVPSNEGRPGVSPSADVESGREQLARAARLAVLREVVALIAHELHQPLGSISASGEAALRWLDRPEPAITEALASTRRILVHSDRAAEVIARVRSNLADVRTVQATCLCTALERAIRGLRLREAFPPIDLVIELAPTLGPAEIDPIEAELLFVQLLRNAWEALDGMERRHLRVDVRTVDEKAVIEVGDTGVGVPAASRPFLFEPFFTTKPGAEGLGLSMARAVVRTVGGRIELLPCRSTGSVFRVELPLAGADRRGV